MAPVSCTYRDMTISDYAAVRGLWDMSGLAIWPVTDTEEGIRRLLVRNPDLSVVSLDGDKLVGCALASHDGRRGFLQQVAVYPALRGHGIARRMIDICLDRFRALQLGWVHLDVENTNDAAISFWLKAGWAPRDRLTRLSLCLLH